MPKKIFLIDDDPDDRLLLCDALAEIDPALYCYTAPDARRALAKLNSGEIELPDIIFLDVNMPGISGWDFLVKLKEHDAYKEIPVMMYSTSSSESDIEKAIRLGALCFFTKPPDYKELKKSLAIVIHNLNDDTLSSIVRASPLFAVPPK